MDFSKFRASGDLSDILIRVEDHDNHLHRFPLFAHSRYFEGLTRQRGPRDSHSPTVVASSPHVELLDFPGGQAVFTLVADFCYNIPLDINKHNVVALRCAAHRLEMFGPGNLVDIADKFLCDAVTSAKLSRSPTPLVTLLTECANVGKLAADAGMVDTILQALVDTWLKSPFKVPSPASSGGGAGGAVSVFSPPKSAAAPGCTDLLLDEACVQQLLRIPHDWFVKLLCQARERGVRLSPLADLGVRYVAHALADTDSRPSQDGGPSEKTAATSTAGDDSTIGFLGETPDSLSTTMDSLRLADRRTELGKLVDAVLMSLPEDVYSAHSVSLEWLTMVLRTASARGCVSRRFLVKMAADKLQGLSAEDLCLVSPSLLYDVVLEARGDPAYRQRACVLADTYLREMARKGVLTADTFRLLATATPPDARLCYDNLYEVVEYVLQNEKDALSDEQCQQLVSTINFDMVTEATLQRALQSQFVSPELIAGASVRLCGRLRSELESVKYIAQLQEDELQKYQLPPTLQASPRVSAALPSGNSDSGFSDSRDSVKTSCNTARASHNALTAARTKLDLHLSQPSAGVFSHPHAPSCPPSSLLYPHSSHATSTEHDISLQNELDFKFDRSFRSLDPRVRSRASGGSGIGGYSSSTSYHHHQPHYRSTYFPYWPKY